MYLDLWCRTYFMSLNDISRVHESKSVLVIMVKNIFYLKIY
jgi:hypothetical protein